MLESKSGAPRHCIHCGRVVHDTLHYRDGYRVDFHFLYTGEVEQNETWDEAAALTRVVIRVRNPRFVYTCIDCYPRPAVQRERARLLRPEAEELA